jgi:non-heme chloroperoxidase
VRASAEVARIREFARCREGDNIQRRVEDGTVRLASTGRIEVQQLVDPAPRQGTAVARTWGGSGPSAVEDREENEIPTITTRDGTEIYYKDWGPKNAQPIVFHHGWPLSSDDWDPQMLYFVGRGYRVIAHDRRGHGRSSQVGDGHDMDHYAADVAAVVEHLDLRNAVHVGHSTGGGEATAYVARHGQSQRRVAKLVLIGAVPPIMVRTPANPGGLPIEVFDGFRQQLAANRAQFYLDLASGPFYSFNRRGRRCRRP